MNSLAKSCIKNIFRTLGFDIRRFRKKDPGHCPFHDFARFASGRDALSPPVLFDVGANYGQTVRQLCAQFPNAPIHAFEPNPVVAERLRSVYAKATNVKVWSMGVGEECTNRMFGINTKTDMSSFLNPGTMCWGEINQTLSVPITRLDTFCSTQKINEIGLLKIDTQGYEAKVIAGGAALFEREAVQAVLVECLLSDLYIGSPPLWQLFQLMAGYGFRLVSIYDQRYQAGLASWLDALFIHERYTSHQ